MIVVVYISLSEDRLRFSRRIGCSFLCVVENALANGNSSLGFTSVLIFQAGAIEKEMRDLRLEGSEFS